MTAQLLSFKGDRSSSVVVLQSINVDRPPGSDNLLCRLVFEQKLPLYAASILKVSGGAWSGGWKVNKPKLESATLEVLAPDSSRLMREAAMDVQTLDASPTTDGTGVVFTFKVDVQASQEDAQALLGYLKREVQVVIDNLQPQLPMVIPAPMVIPGDTHMNPPAAAIEAVKTVAAAASPAKEEPPAAAPVPHAPPAAAPEAATVETAPPAEPKKRGRPPKAKPEDAKPATQEAAPTAQPATQTPAEEPKPEAPKAEAKPANGNGVRPWAIGQYSHVKNLPQGGRYAGLIYKEVDGLVEIHDIKKDPILVPKDLVKMGVSLMADRPYKDLKEMMTEYEDMAASKNKIASWDFLFDALSRAFNARTIERRPDGSYLLTDEHLETAIDLAPYVTTT
jgi:hypothetical protein